MKLSYVEDIEDWRKEFKFHTDINIRFSETDMFGHMNNVSPFIYFEQARIEYLKALDLFNLKSLSETAPIVADLHCDYLAQVYFDETIKLSVKTDHIGKSSIDIHYLGEKEDGSICFTGRGRLVKINIKTGKSAPFTEEEIRKLEEK